MSSRKIKLLIPRKSAPQSVAIRSKTYRGTQKYQDKQLAKKLAKKKLAESESAPIHLHPCVNVNVNAGNEGIENTLLPKDLRSGSAFITLEFCLNGSNRIFASSSISIEKDSQTGEVVDISSLQPGLNFIRSELLKVEPCGAAPITAEKIFAHFVTGFPF